MAWDPVKRTKVWAIHENFPVWTGTLVTAGDVAFYGTLDRWFKAVDARSGALLWQFHAGSGFVGQPVTYKGADGAQYVAILSGVGGWPGAVAAAKIDPRVRNAALGFVGATQDLPAYTSGGSELLVFKLATGGRLPHNPILRTPTAHSWRQAMRSLNSLGRGGRSRCLGSVAVALVIGLALSAPASLVAAETDDFKVCADPNNLPFSNASGAGFENELAELVAGELGKHVTYTWWAQRRGFVRNTLNAGRCDVVMGVPVDYELVETTRPYYRSTYVFVSRAGPPARCRVDQGPSAGRTSRSAFTSSAATARIRRRLRRSGSRTSCRTSSAT